MVKSFDQLLEAIDIRQKMVRSYLFDDDNKLDFEHQHLNDAIYSYPRTGGKSLRPAVLMFCTGLVGGNEQDALPAAAAIEMYHTWTLVHDDIIDKDELRRGAPTVHVEFSRRAVADLGYNHEIAEHYGLSLAILAGDMQQGWSISLLTSLAQVSGMPLELVINLISDLFKRVQMILVRGETLDIIYSQTPIDQISDDQILNMLWQKTGILYEFAGRTGAAIGMRDPAIHKSEIVRNISNFTGKCGTAFQIQDDILGIVGNQKQLGKPVGSDIREGKRTLILLESIRNMSHKQREFTFNVLGNENATKHEMGELTQILRNTGGIEYAQQVARQYVEEALEYIKDIPKSEYKYLLESWANYMIEREF